MRRWRTSFSKVNRLEDASAPQRAPNPQQRELRVPATSTLVSVWDVAAQDHWYDLTITSADDPDYHRRLAGHRETGKPSRSDPAIASA